MNTVVIYHSADFDGIFCREIAKKHFGDKAEYIGWDYGDPIPSRKWFNTESDGSPTTKLYMLDISVEGLMDYPGLVWIDHHKTAMEKYPGVKGYQIDGVAACRLAWQYFSTTSRDPKTFALPTKEDFVERRVNEPLSVRLAGEYDIWDKRDPRAELFQHGLRSCGLTTSWFGLLRDRRIMPIREVEGLMDMGHPPELDSDGAVDESKPHVEALLKNGKMIQYVRREQDARICEGGAFELEWEGLRFLALNSGGNSLTFASVEKPHHDGLLMFRWAATKWRISLYHSQAHKERDLSEIAKKYGGGGHRGACGFELKTLPFLS